MQCIGCEGFGTHLDEAGAAALHAQVPAWARDGVRSIARVIRFGTFRDAFALATRIALLAEDQGHHPDLEIGWGRLRIGLTTHALGGLTSNDFVIAAHVDAMLDDGGGAR